MTIVASAALQVLDDNQVRLHAAVDIEDIAKAPHHIAEKWRGSREVGLQLATASWGELASQLREAFRLAICDFHGAR